MNREKEFLRNTGILAFGTVVPKAVNLLILPIYTAYLTREEYGIYDLIMVLAILFIPLATMQIQSSAFRFLIENDTDYDKRKSIITNTFVFLLPSVLVALMILYIFLYRIENAIRFGICVYFLMDVFMNVGGQIARGSRKNHIYSIGAIINAGANLLFSIFFLIILKEDSLDLYGRYVQHVLFLLLHTLAI